MIAETSDEPLLARGHRPDVDSFYQLQGGYRALERALHYSPDDLIKAIQSSALLGRGGAGFLVERKSHSAFSQPVGEKFIIANADEGDAGAYIDRFLLEDAPHAVIEVSIRPMPEAG